MPPFHGRRSLPPPMVAVPSSPCTGSQDETKLGMQLLNSKEQFYAFAKKQPAGAVATSSESASAIVLSDDGSKVFLVCDQEVWQTPNCLVLAGQSHLGTLKKTLENELSVSLDPKANMVCIGSRHSQGSLNSSRSYWLAKARGAAPLLPEEESGLARTGQWFETDALVAALATHYGTIPGELSAVSDARLLQGADMTVSLSVASVHENGDGPGGAIQAFYEPALWMLHSVATRPPADGHRQRGMPSLRRQLRDKKVDVTFLR